VPAFWPAITVSPADAIVRVHRKADPATTAG
jgi:hypothetical protein